MDAYPQYADDPIMLYVRTSVWGLLALVPPRKQVALHDFAFLSAVRARGAGDGDGDGDSHSVAVIARCTGYRFVQSVLLGTRPSSQASSSPPAVHDSACCPLSTHYSIHRSR